MIVVHPRERALFVNFQSYSRSYIMARGSTWMKAKMAKLAAERRAAFNPETTVRRPGHTIERSNALVAEISALTEKYTGVVTLCPTKDIRAREDVGVMGKTKRAFDGRTYGNGARREMGLALRMHDGWATDDRLIRNGAVVK
jgi:hypothetical protein